MAKETLIIPVDPASELARVLADAEAPVVLDSAGVRYTVEREDVSARYDAETVLRELRKSRGALRGVDTATLLADLAQQRRQDPGRPS